MSLYICLASMALLGSSCFLIGWFFGLRHGMEYALNKMEDYPYEA